MNGHDALTLIAKSGNPQGGLKFRLYSKTYTFIRGKTIAEDKIDGRTEGPLH